MIKYLKTKFANAIHSDKHVLYSNEVQFIARITEGRYNIT